MISTEDEARAWFRETLEVSPVALQRLDALAVLLTAENERQNLVSKGSIEHLWVRHFVDSAQLLRVPRGTMANSAWLDLGTGAGFPGLVIAICRPDLEVVMVESRRLRSDWLSQTSNALNLPNSTIVPLRVEHLASRAFGTISARAFAPLEKLIKLSARFSTPDTHWLLPKGAKAEQELSMLSDRCAHLFHVEQSITDADAGVIAGRLLGHSFAKPDNTAPKGRST